MKRIMQLLAVALLAQAAFASEYPISDGPIVPGEWNSDYRGAQKYALDNNIPFIAIVSKYPSQCHFCSMFHDKWTCDEFLEWARARKPIMGAFYSKTPDGTDSDWVDWVAGKNGAAGSISGFPMIRIYWKKSDGTVVWDRFRGSQSSIDDLDGDKTKGSVYDFIARLEQTMGAYTPTGSYAGGSFAVDETEGNRLEAEAGTGEISVELVRASDVADSATNNVVKVIGPDGAIAQEVRVAWAAGQTNQTVSVDVSKVNFAKNGDKALLVAVDAEGNEQATSTVTYVTGSGETSSNPLWLGERKAVADRSADKPVLEFGEWTMDLDVAKAKVAAADGDAYTLVSVQGALWCPDCANTERNFVDVKDKSGVNRLSAWAKDNQVAFVAVDVPSFATNSIENISRPTLLSRKAIATTLARPKEYPASGADGSLTNAMVRSGLGYLTRKGVTDAEADECLERNRQLVTTDFSEGGFHSAADDSPFRTGVPIFVVLDKQGNVKARLTRFARVSPMADIAWDDVIKRFDELLAIAKDGSAHDDGGVLENDFPSSGMAGFSANGGSVAGEISHCDFRDVYKLENFGGNAVLQIDAHGDSDAAVSLSFVTLDASGKKKTVGTAAVGKLSDGVSLRNTFTGAGEYYVEIAGESYDAEGFSVANAATNAFHAYSLSGAVVLVPGEVRSGATAPAGSTSVTMELVEGTAYHITGLADDPGDALEKSGEGFYVAKVSGSAQLAVATAGGEVVYQVWNPGSVGFAAAAKTVKESVGDVAVQIGRAGGRSGDVTVKVSLDEEATTFYNSEGEARFLFDEAVLTWKEGEDFATNVTVTVLDDIRFDGNGDIVLRLELVKDENGDTALTTTNYVLTVTEDDKQSAGKAAFTGAEPFFSKKGAVYARESEGATVYAERIEATDGYVTVKVNATNGAKTEIGGVETNVVAWANHKSERQAIKVTGVAAGKSAKLTLANPTDGLKVLTASNAVTVVAVADDAPAFVQAADARTVYRYVATSNVYPVAFAEGVDAAAAKLTFTKLSGTLPAGLKAYADGAALAISGVPTAKAGTYTMVYQVSQKVGGKTTPGLTIELAYTISDPTVAGGEGVPYNAAVAAAKSRTFMDIPAIVASDRRLVGTLQVTIPQTGKASAKLACSVGTVSFTAKGWESFAHDGDKSLTAELASTTKGYGLRLVAKDDGSVAATIATPDGEASAKCDGGVWSKADPAAAWAGYYTVALVSKSIAEADGWTGVAPRGNGYLTLKMNSTSAVNSGTVTWAGLLPNGTAVSGSAVLCRDDACNGVTTLPVYKRSSTDVVAALVSLCDTGRAESDADVDACWHHAEKYEATSYTVEFSAYGGLYSETNNLALACEEGYETTTPKLTFDVAGLGGTLNVGTPGAVAAATVSVGEKTLTVEKNNAAGATLSFNRSTGVVSGTFKLPYTTESGAAKTLSASYKGVVMIGWGEGCGCGREGEELPAFLPFVVGSFTVSDKVSVPTGKKDVTVTVKRGGAAKVDK